MDKRKRMDDTGNITVDMYYIMDSSSNYYRLHADGQLVVAADKDQAGIFSIKEIRNKLGTGKKSGFYRIASVNGNMIWNMSNMEEFNKNNIEEKVDKFGNVTKIVNPYLISTYFFKSINPLTSKTPGSRPSRV